MVFYHVLLTTPGCQQQSAAIWHRFRLDSPQGRVTTWNQQQHVKPKTWAGYIHRGFPRGWNWASLWSWDNEVQQWFITIMTTNNNKWYNIITTNKHHNRRWQPTTIIHKRSSCWESPYKLRFPAMANWWWFINIIDLSSTIKHHEPLFTIW